jgi:hypothetical protein
MRQHMAFVRKTMGDPDQVADKLIGGSEPWKDLWIYRNRTLDPVTGKPDPPSVEIQVHFSHGQVEQVFFGPIIFERVPTPAVGPSFPK